MTGKTEPQMKGDGNIRRLHRLRFGAPMVLGFMRRSAPNGDFCQKKCSDLFNCGACPTAERNLRNLCNLRILTSLCNLRINRSSSRYGSSNGQAFVNSVSLW